MTMFENRDEAGRKLADEVRTRLGPRAGDERRLVLALPRGGMPVALPVAAALDAVLDVLVVRKLGAPGHEEYAMGALASGGIEVLDQDVVQRLGVEQDQLDRIVQRERAELKRREQRFRGDRPGPKIDGATVVLVDDGVATGSTMRAALDAVRAAGAGRVVVAVPLAPADTVRRLERSADEVICLTTPSPFFAVGQGYREFPQVQDDAVAAMLSRSRRA